MREQSDNREREYKFEYHGDVADAIDAAQPRAISDIARSRQTKC